jgi:hypothetical protein
MFRIPQWVFDRFPWLEDVVPWLIFLRDFWHDYQGLIVLVGFFVVWRLLRRERLKLGERIDTLAQIVRAARDEAEAALGLPSQAPPVTPAPQPPIGPQPPQAAGSAAVPPAPEDVGATNWETVRLGWRDVRDRIELLIEGIRHAGVRSKYSRIARYTYRYVINSLQKDGVITSAQVADKLRSMDTTFNILKFRPRTVSASDVAQFTSALEFVDPHLPKLPDTELSADPPTDPAS